MATAVKRRRSGSEATRLSSASSSLAAVRDMREMMPVGEDCSEAFWGATCSRAAPFTDDEICQLRRNAIDYSVKVTRFLFIYLFVYLFISSTSNGIEVQAKNILAEWPTQG